VSYEKISDDRFRLPEEPLPPEEYRKLIGTIGIGPASATAKPPK
jgi:hypothetical protein